MMNQQHSPQNTVPSRCVDCKKKMNNLCRYGARRCPTCRYNRGRKKMVKKILVLMLVALNIGWAWDCAVTKVVDGDTVDVICDVGLGIWKQERIRLERVDVYERYEPLGKEATAFVKSKLTGTVEVNTTGDRGKYGRLIAEIYYQDGDQIHRLSEELLARGYVRRVYD